MDLRQETRITHPATCYVCRWVGKYVIIWPLQPEGNATNTHARFYVFVNVNEKNVAGLRSGKKTIDVCAQHAEAMYQNWVLIAQDEVDLQKAWDAWIERTE